MHLRAFNRAELRQMREARDATAAADEERSIAHGHAETLAALLDRHPGDAGDDPDAVANIGNRIADLCSEVRALLGEPAEAVWRGHEIVGLIRRRPL